MQAEKPSQERPAFHFLLGLVVALGLTLSAFEHGVYKGYQEKSPFGDESIEWVESDPVPVTMRAPKPPPSPKPRPTPQIAAVVPVEILPEPLVQQKNLPEFPVEAFDVYEPIETVVMPAIDPTKFPDVYPKFPGGDSALAAFLGSELKYPGFARDNGIDGPVYIEFVVDANGDIRLPSVGAVGRVPHEVLQKEAERVVKIMPQWIPGQQGLHKVPVTMTLPVVFNLKR